MKTPRWFMGLALLFWGWQTDLLPWAALMAAGLEAAHFTRTRWEFADRDLNRVCDLCIVLFLGAGMLLYSTEDRLVFVYKFAQWLPFCFFPAALAQSYGDRPSIPLNAFNWLLRRIPQSQAARVSFNVSYGYYALCLLAASASTHPNQFFYAGMSVLVLLALWSARPKRVSWPGWIALAVLVTVCGRFSHEGLRVSQERMVRVLGGWIAELLRTSADPREYRTHIGYGSRRPLSGKIVLRLRAPAPDIPPDLLREGAYDIFRKGTWVADTNVFTQVSLSSNGFTQLLAAKPVFSSVEIAGYFPDSEVMLPLPHGTFAVEDLLGVLRTNRLGVATIEAGLGLLDFRADYRTGPSMDAPPGPSDLNVPNEERPVLAATVASLGLDRMNERQKIRAVSRFFREHFRYSLKSPRPAGRDSRKTPLGRFLTENRSGHCEYFATATVLLLRQAGVNARYIIGYAVPESARRGDTYLVRERHSHAWALVYFSDSHAWEQVDNTPSSWVEDEEAGATRWQSELDFMSNLYFQFSKWRWSKGSLAIYAQWALAPLGLYLAWRILSTRRRQQASAGAAPGPPEPVWPGMDSELYLINRRLAGSRLCRQPNELLSRWEERLEEALPASRTLRGIFHMHRRLRFDPRGLAADEREMLRRQAMEWLAEFTVQPDRRPSSGPE